MVVCLNASKLSCSTFLPFLEFSLLSQNAGGGFDVSGSIYIVPIALKISSITFCNSLSSSTSFLSLFLFNYASLLLATPFN
jgi:hypothetical protein